MLIIAQFGYSLPSCVFPSTIQQHHRIFSLSWLHHFLISHHNIEKRTSNRYWHRIFFLSVATIIAGPVFLIEMLVIDSYSITINTMFRSRIRFQYDAWELYLLPSILTFFAEAKTWGTWNSRNLSKVMIS